MNYRNHYNAIIVQALTRPTPEGYTESHHILPRCMGGTDDPSNLVRLTAREHFVSHQLLVKMHPEHPGLVLAVVFLRKRRNGEVVGNSHTYSWIKDRAAKVVSEKQKARFLANPESWVEAGHRSATPTSLAKRSGENHHFNTNPQSRINHQAAVQKPEYLEQFRGANNPMNKPGVREAQLAAVRTPEQREIRRRTMLAVTNRPDVLANKIAALKLRSYVFKLTNAAGESEQFVGNDAGCAFFNISEPTWMSSVKRGSRDGWNIERLGTVAELGLSV